MGKLVRSLLRVRVLLVMVMVSVLLAIPLANGTEAVTTRWAEMLMQLVRFGSPRVHLLDAQGVPRVRYANLGGSYYNPVYVGIYGLHYYDRWLESGANAYFLDYYTIEAREAADDEWERRFLATADWFVDHAEPATYVGRSYAVYSYRFPWPIYDLEPPWRSAMAQGLAMQVLLRAWRLTRNSTYLETAHRVRDALFVPVTAGGVTYFDAPDRWWYEEYAAPGAKASRVFNGMAHVLIALDEFAHEASDPVAAELFTKGLRALLPYLDAYTDPELGWTRYDILGRPANYKYHHINVNLARKLHALTGIPALGIWREWSRLRTPFFTREFLHQPPDEVDLLVLFVNAALALSFMVVTGGLVLYLRERLR